MGYSVQFFGEASVLKAFINSDCSNWAVLQGRQFMFKYEGTDSAEAAETLKELLKMISGSSASDAVYTLRTYDYGDEQPKAMHVVGPGKRNSKAVKETSKRKIYDSTPYDNSFNFKLFDLAESPRSRQYSEVTDLKTEFAEMKLMMQELLKKKVEQGEENQNDSGLAGVFSGLLEMPEVKAAIAGRVIQLFNGVSNKIGTLLNGPDQAAKIAGPEAVTMLAPQDQPIVLPQTQVNKLNEALTNLVKLDPNFPEHLHKLSQIATKDPATYSGLISMLNKYSI